MYTNKKIDASGPEFDLAEDLLKCAKEANRLDGYYAQQPGAFGSIHDAIEQVITASLIAQWKEYGPDIRKWVAKRLLTEAYDNWENIRYQVDLWNEGVIGAYNRTRNFSVETL